MLSPVCRPSAMKLACLSLPVLRPSPAAAPRRIALAHLWCNMQLGTGSGSQSHGSAKRWRLEEPREAEPTAPKLLGEIPAKQKTPPGPGRTSNPDFGVTAEAIMPPVDAPVALAEAIRAVFPGVFDTASSAKKVTPGEAAACRFRGPAQLVAPF